MNFYPTAKSVKTLKNYLFTKHLNEHSTYTESLCQHLPGELHRTPSYITRNIRESFSALSCRFSLYKIPMNITCSVLAHCSSLLADLSIRSVPLVQNVFKFHLDVTSCSFPQSQKWTSSCLGTYPPCVLRKMNELLPKS